MSTKDGNRTDNILEDWEAQGVYRDAGNRDFQAGEHPDAGTFDAFFYYTLKALSDLDQSVQFGTKADRPTASSDNDNHLYYATDEDIWYQSDGTSWNQVSFKDAIDINFDDANVPYSAPNVQEALLGVQSEIDNVADQSQSEWVDSALSPVYVAADQFKVTGDQTDIFVANRRVKATLDASTVYSAVRSASYDSVNDETTVSLFDSVLDSTLQKAEHGLIKPGEQGSLARLIASAVNYDNSASGLSATDVKNALDEIVAEKLSNSGGTMTGSLSIDQSGDGAELINFLIDRPWILKQTDIDQNAKLTLQTNANLKSFRFLSEDSSSYIDMILQNGGSRIEIDDNATWHNGNTLKNLTRNGFLELPNGWIMEWGQTNQLANGEKINITFPITFPNLCFGVVSGQLLESTFSSNTDNQAQVYDLSVSSFNLHSNEPEGLAGSMSYFWVAIGY